MRTSLFLHEFGAILSEQTTVLEWCALTGHELSIDAELFASLPWIAWQGGWALVMIALILNGTWPLSAIVLCITNDFVWWIPFERY